VIQKSTREGSQGISGKSVIVGVIDGIALAVGDGGVNVGMTFVFAAVGVSIDRDVAQDTRIGSTRKVKIHFIRFLGMAEAYRDEVILPYVEDCFVTCASTAYRSFEDHSGTALRSARKY
jgi:hypothetical protein